ncbi:MAG: DUF1573 domain-containing protein [Chitinophagaceae bacterium]|jgi:hypothetical protein|nr:DUF1573 domain-containing protein [Chitinophagaceae bacterium]
MKWLKFVIPIAVIVFFSCKNRTNPYRNNLHLKPSYIAQIDIKNYSNIEWLDTLRDFGTIKKGDSVQLSFKYKNTGDKPLFISEVQTFYGCTNIRYSEEPVFSGETGTFSVTFQSGHYSGLVNKKIFVASNSNNGTEHYLWVKGFVTPADSVKH